MNYFYKITNNINGKYYYGVHSTDNIDDGYMGSGIYLNRAIKKYGKENFTKEILKFFDTPEEMFEYEKQIVNVDLLKDVNCYNIHIGGRGGSVKGEMNPIYGRKFSDDHKKKISDALKGKEKSEIHKQHLSENYTYHTWNKGFSGYNIKWSDEARENYKIYWKNHQRSPEQYKKSWETRRKNGTTYTSNGLKYPDEAREKLKALKWMNNGERNIRVKQDDIKLYEDMGFKLGRIFNKFNKS